MKNRVVSYAFLNALGTAAYVVLVVMFIFFLGQTFQGTDETILIPIAMLMLFVFSAAFTGTLVLGRPIMWHLDGKKKEAFSLLIYTLGILLVLTIITFALMVFVIFGVN